MCYNTRKGVNNVTTDEYRVLRYYICNRHDCRECPIDKYYPCDEATPKEDLLKYSLKEAATSGCSKKILDILNKYAKAVIV